MEVIEFVESLHNATEISLQNVEYFGGIFRSEKFPLNGSTFNTYRDFF